MPVGISGTRFVFHDEWRYDFNKNRRRWSGIWGPTPSSRLSAADSNRVRAELFSWPVVGSLMKNHYMMESMDQYLAQHGMTWADVDPMKMNQIFGSNSSTALQLSRNVLRLYRRCRLGVGAKAPRRCFLSTPNFLGVWGVPHFPHSLKEF